MERKGERVGTAERFLPILLMSKSCLWLQCIGAYILPSQAKLQKNQNQKLLQGTNLEENQKVTKRVKKVKGVGSQQCRMNEQWLQDEQCAHEGNFAG